jgi:hypothetical protein
LRTPMFSLISRSRCPGRRPDPVDIPGAKFDRQEIRHLGRSVLSGSDFAWRTAHL